MSDGATDRPIPGPKARALLAVLLLNANQPVSLDVLETALWGERPPATAEASLRNLVARLRRSLGPTGGARLTATTSGYLMRVQEDELDTRRFERHIRLARAADQAEDWHTVAREAGAALALWRGEPLSDLAYLTLPFPQCDQWREDRLQALEWRFEGELGLGRPQGAVAELTALVGEHPLREAFHRQLMVALHRTGQRAEALAAYRRLRRTLVDELGIEPGQAVQEAHLAILNADGRPPEATRARPVPAQLPSPPAHFVGRQNELATMRQTLTARSDQPALVVVSGMAGVGKSALALQCAESLRAEFPDGQLFLNLRGATPGLTPLQPQQALATLLRGLGVEPPQIPDDVQAASGVFRSTLASSRTLLVLDNAESAAQVRPLIPAGPGCAVVVTSRSALAVLGGSHIRLATLTPSQSVALVSLASGRGTPTDQDAASRLVELCGRLPLALRIVAARLAARDALPIGTLVEQLAAQEERLDHLELDDLSVRQSLAVAYDALRHSGQRSDHAAAGALRTIGALDLPEYSAPLMAHLMETSAGRAGLALDRLADLAFLSETALGRFVPHDLVRDFARELAAEGGEERSGVVGRALEWYAAAACRSMLTLAPQTHAGRSLPSGDPAEPFIGPEAALDWGDRELPNVLAIAERCAREGIRPADLLTLVQASFVHLRSRGRLSELSALNKLALGSARRCGDLRAQAQALSDLAAAEFEAARYEQALALIEEVSELAEVIGDDSMRQLALNNSGMLLELLGRDTEAVSVLDRSLALSVKRGDAYNEAVALSSLGNLHEKHDPHQAIGRHLRSIEASDRAGRPDLRLAGLANLGSAHLALAQPAKAIGFFEQVLDTPPGTIHWQVERECRLGVIRALRELGEPGRAVESCLDALDLAATRGDTYGQGLAHHQYGLLLRDLGELSQALAHWQSALRLLADGNAKILPELRAAIEAAEKPVLSAPQLH